MDAATSTQTLIRLGLARAMAETGTTFEYEVSTMDHKVWGLFTDDLERALRMALEHAKYDRPAVIERDGEIYAIVWHDHTIEWEIQPARHDAA
jgi:hypothetical protein